MADVTSGVAETRYLLTAERFPVDNVVDNAYTMNGVSSSSEEHQGVTCSDLKRTDHDDDKRQKRRVDGACWWPHSGGPPRQTADGQLMTNDDGALTRLTAADSAVGRLALMIQRFAANNNQYNSPSVTSPPHRRLMTSSGDVTSSSRDCSVRYFCHVCPYVGQSSITLLAIKL